MSRDVGRVDARAVSEPGTAAGLGSRAAAFAFDYLPIAGYLALLVALGAAVGWAFPDAAARTSGQPLRAPASGK